MAKLRGWRRVATGIWNAPDDPQIYGALELDATNVRAYCHDAQAAGHRVTPTHMVGRALAHAIRAVPEINVRIWGGRAEPRSTVDIFFVAAIEGGRDLSGVKVVGADEKSATEIAAELSRRAKTLKSGDDVEFNQSKRVMESLPLPLLRLALRAAAFVSGSLSREVRSIGVRASPFGSAMVTSVGMLGLPMGFAPLADFYKVPLLLLVGEITEKAVVVDGRIVARPILPVTATIDHRYADGWQISKLLAAFRAYVADPAAFEPSIAPASSSDRQPSTPAK